MQDEGVKPSDLDLFERTVILRNGASLVVREFTMRQRDKLAELVNEVGDEQVREIVNAFLGPDPTEVSKLTDDAAREALAEREVEIDVVAAIELAAGKIGDGVLSRFLAAAIDNPDNRDKWEGSSATDYVLDYVHLSDEAKLYEGIAGVNDLIGYLGNLFRLLPTAGGKIEAKGSE